MIIELTPDEVEEVRYRIGSGSMREGEYVLMIRGDSIVDGERITLGTPLALALLPPMQDSYPDCEAVLAELTANRFEIKARS